MVKDWVASPVGLDNKKTYYHRVSNNKWAQYSPIRGYNALSEYVTDYDIMGYLSYGAQYVDKPDLEQYSIQFPRIFVSECKSYIWLMSSERDGLALDLRSLTVTPAINLSNFIGDSRTFEVKNDTKKQLLEFFKQYA